MDIDHYLLNYYVLGLEVSQIEPKLDIAHARLASIEIDSRLGSITNESDFKIQARLTKSSRASSSSMS